MSSQASGINILGQSVGLATLADNTTTHAFRTRPNRAINPATDDLGTLGGSSSSATHLNIFGQAVGSSSLRGDAVFHAFRTGPNARIHAATDDLGTLGGSFSSASSIDDFGQVVGWASTPGDAEQHAFLFSGGTMHDLNDLIAPGGKCTLNQVSDINDFGQIAANGTCGTQTHALLLTPIFRASARPPIQANGSSVFVRNGRAVPVKFALTRNGAHTCALPPATISITRASGSAMQHVNESAFAGSDGAAFRTAGCQYLYQLDSGSLARGTYRVDIRIHGVLVGNAVFVIR
jgi:probable HAF family extracellular repeat protein